jgi:hypothetical protein
LTEDLRLCIMVSMDMSHHVRAAEQMETEFCVGMTIEPQDAEKIGTIAHHVVAIAGDAGAEIGQLRVKQIMLAIETAYRLGRAGMLRDLGDTNEDYYQFCSDVLGEDMGAGKGDPPDLSAFWGYIADS